MTYCENWKKKAGSAPQKSHPPKPVKPKPKHSEDMTKSGSVTDSINPFTRKKIPAVMTGTLFSLLLSCLKHFIHAVYIRLQ